MATRESAKRKKNSDCTMLKKRHCGKYERRKDGERALKQVSSWVYVLKIIFKGNSLLKTTQNLHLYLDVDYYVTVGFTKLS